MVVDIHLQDLVVTGSVTKKLNFTVGQEYTVDFDGLSRGL